MLIRLPYKQRPPSSAQAPDLRIGLTRGLAYAGLHPRETGWSRNNGLQNASFPSNTPGTATRPFLGQCASVGTLTTPCQFAGFPIIRPPLTVMCNLTLDAPGTGRYYFAFGGSGTGGRGFGLGMSANTAFVITYGGVADYFISAPVALTSAVDYTVITVLDTSSATVYYRKQNSNDTAYNTSATAVGTVSGLSASTGLNIGCRHTGAAYNGSWAGRIGAWGMWDRALRQDEAFQLLDNPYQLWSHQVILASPAVGGGGSSSATATASSTFVFSLALTGVGM